MMSVFSPVCDLTGCMGMRAPALTNTGKLVQRTFKNHFGVAMIFVTIIEIIPRPSGR